MRRILATSLLLALSVGVAAAQPHGTGASVVSFGQRMGPPGIPASVTSVGPNGFGRPAPGFGFGGGGGIRFGQIPHPNYGRGCQFCTRAPLGYSYPVYVPYVPSYYGTPVVYEPQSVYAAQPVEEPVYEQPRVVTTTRADDAAPADDARYGDHYLDARERRGEPAPSVRVTPGPPRETAPAAEEPKPPEPATLLIFKDGSQREVRNYAIIGDTVWDLSDHLTRKIPLASLDLEKTMKANDERGTPFRYPRHS